MTAFLQGQNEKAPVATEAEPTPNRQGDGSGISAISQPSDRMVSLVANAHSTATTTVPLERIADWIKSGRFQRDIGSIRAICATKPNGWEEQVAERKRRLPGFTPSGVFRRRASYALLRHSGLIVADLDKMSASELARVRVILTQDPHVAALFTSPTGTGLKVLFRVPADPRLHYASWKAVSDRIRRTCGVDVDPSGSDVARLCFVSFDPDLYVATSPTVLPFSVGMKPGVAPAAGQHTRLAPAKSVCPDVRQAIAETLLGPIDWQSDHRGYCQCPGIAMHTAQNSARDCQVTIDAVPTVYCFHASCRPEIDRINASLRSMIGKAEVQSVALSFIKNGGEL